MTSTVGLIEEPTVWSPRQREAAWQSAARKGVHQVPLVAQPSVRLRRRRWQGDTWDEDQHERAKAQTTAHDAATQWLRHVRIVAAREEPASLAELAGRFGVSPATLYTHWAKHDRDLRLWRSRTTAYSDFVQGGPLPAAVRRAYARTAT